jgi:hypothetical protein
MAYDIPEDDGPADPEAIALAEGLIDPFDFSYLAIGSVPAAARRAVARPPLCSEAA